MGLFSGSFGTGLITGLASSVDKSLQNAMDKRDEELSSARKFWQTRQAQKMDLAEQRDSRIKKSLNRLIDEMDGDVASGLAAFKAAGGDPDSVELFIKDLDETLAAGLEYNLKDKLKLDGIDLSQFGDLTRERAFASVRTELSPVDIQMEDMSGLAKIGLGMKDMGKGISEDVNKMIPAREQEAIEGITGAVIDRSGMITSERYKKELLSNMPDLEKQIQNNVLMMTTGKDSMNKPVDDATKIKLKSQNAQLLTALNRIEAAKSSGTSGGLSASQISATYSKRLSKLNDTLKFVDTDGQVSIQPPDADSPIVGGEATKYYMNEVAAMESAFIKDAILNEDGIPKSKEATDMAYALGLGKVYESTQKEIISAASGQAKSPTGAEPKKPKSASEAGFATANDVKNNPFGYISAVRTNNPNITDGELRLALIKSGVPMYEVDELIPFDASAQPQ